MPVRILESAEPDRTARRVRIIEAADQSSRDQASDESGDESRGYRAEGDYSLGRKINAVVRAAADVPTFGFADEMEAGAQALPAFFTGGKEAFGKKYRENLANERATDAIDAKELPVSHGIGLGAGFLSTLGAGAVIDAARLAPNALRAGGGFAGNLARGSAAGATYGGLSAAGAGDGDIPERLQQAVPGVVVGGALGAASVPVVGVLGMGVNALRNHLGPPIERAANALRPRTDIPAATDRLNALREAGAHPSFVSATDEAGRGFVRATASRMTPAREVVQRRAEASALDLPDRIGRQARTHLSDDPRTPRQIAQRLGEDRGAAADANFSAVRSESIAMAPETVQALRTGQGRAAINEAAQRERDPEVRAALNRLAAQALDEPSTEITVGMADRISRVLAGQAQAAARAGDNDLAMTLGNLSRDIRRPAAAAVPGYRQALDEYGDQSRLMEAADRGEDFLTRNTDEFVAETPGPGQPGNELARATARRAVERAAGENVSAAPGVARRLAYAPEQQARNAALLGDEGAEAFQAGMGAEARVTRDLQDVAPRTGSQTQNKTADQEVIGGIAQGLATAAQPSAWVPALLNRLKTLGISDRDAEAVASIATDPAQIDDLLARIARRGNPEMAQQLGDVINQIVGRTAGAQLAPPTPRQ